VLFCAFPPNAKTHLLPEAAARHERKLEAVRCSAKLGQTWPRPGGVIYASLPQFSHDVQQGLPLAPSHVVPTPYPCDRGTVH
jgi:hypothetical protein